MSHMGSDCRNGQHGGTATIRSPEPPNGSRTAKSVGRRRDGALRPGQTVTERLPHGGGSRISSFRPGTLYSRIYRTKWTPRHGRRETARREAATPLPSV